MFLSGKHLQCVEDLHQFIMLDPVVTIDQGKLLGKIQKNIKGHTFYSFQGIPYAKAPLNDLRFKAPQPPETWDGIRDATKEGSECYSRHMVYKQHIIGSEDCLFLNVYTPQIPKEDLPLKPVMVWIHGGGFRHGSSKTDFYGPEYLLTEDIVLVSINYRLGIFGFLSFDDPSLGVPGNAGLKDMVMALRWVKKNISNFAGDPNNVTIFGGSAGAAAVHYLILSPLAKGLFHKAILQSGTALNTFARGKNLSSEFSKVLNMPEINERKILEYLMNLSVEQLFGMSEKVIDLCDIYNNYGVKRPFAPVVEKASAEAFITDEPIELINSGNYNKVPTIFGYNTREGMLLEIVMKPRKPEMPKDFEAIIPFTLDVSRGSDSSQTIANKIKNFYFGEGYTLDKFYLLHTDNYFVRDIMFATKRHARTSSCPVYLYRMSVDTKLNIFKHIDDIKAPGVAHGDDIGYLFKTEVSPELAPGSLEEKSVKRFLKYWTNFAKTGNPNNCEENIIIPWKPVKTDEINFIDIGEELSTGINPEQERLHFWDEIVRHKSSYSII